MKREDYYTNDYEGFLHYNLSRAYNDLYLNNILFNTFCKEENDLSRNMTLYIFKNGMSNIKETLKLLRKAKYSSHYATLYSIWLQNPRLNKLLNDLSDELEDPKLKSNSVNARYLSMRNDVFHYCVETKDFDFYVKTTQDLSAQNVNVKIEYDEKGDYLYEVGADLPLAFGTFDNDESLKEITKLRNNVIEFLSIVLKEYYKSKK